MKKTLLKKYAKLIARVGANVQKGQKVIVYSEAELYEFTPLVVDECYKAGASCVSVEWRCQPITKLSYKNRTLKSLSEVPEWQKAKMQLMTEELPCRIHLIGEDPDGIKGVNVDKLQKANIAVSKVMKPYRDKIENRHQWTIAAVPTVAWAKKVFPNDRKSVAVEKLWAQILASVRVTEDNDPAAAWEAHNKTFAEKSRFLNDCKFDMIEYKSSNGTDFRVGLMPQGVWHGGCDKTLSGTVFNPNLPTEEIFTSPMKGKAEGRVVSTKPLSYQGHIINNFYRNILERYDTKQSYLQLIAVNLLCFHRYRSAEIYHQHTICDRLLSGRRCFHRFLIQNAFGGYLKIKCFLHT